MHSFLLLGVHKRGMSSEADAQHESSLPTCRDIIRTSDPGHEVIHEACSCSGRGCFQRSYSAEIWTKRC